MEWLNRIGIILNFFAGFMLAPELIGLERLKNIERNLEISLSKLIFTIEKNSNQTNNRNSRMKLIGMSTLPFIGKTFISNPTRADLFEQVFFYRQRDRFFLYGMSFLLIMFGVLSFAAANGLFWLELLIECIILGLVFMFFRGLGDFITSINNNIDQLSFLSRFLFYSFMTFLTPGVFLAITFSGFLGWQKIPYIILKYQLELFSFLLKKLLGEQRLRILLIFWGIIFFILGNLLQLVATFN